MDVMLYRDESIAAPTSRTRRLLVRSGLTLLIPSGCYFLLGLVGLVPTAFLAIGSGSGLRTIASVAVAGCILAAIGYWDEDIAMNNRSQRS